MAKYTELLAEYLKDGGELPAVFDDIQGLKELFTGRYIEREIGFETPDLFQIKLEYKANLLVPIYKQRMDDLAAAYAAQSNPIKKRIRSGGTQHEYGERNTTNTNDPNTVTVKVNDYPTAGNVTASRVPSTINETDNPQTKQTYHADEYTDTETYQNITDTEEGATLSEALQRLQNAEREGLKNLMDELLTEFEPLFMEIW